jgi:glutaredoxin
MGPREVRRSRGDGGILEDPNERELREGWNAMTAIEETSESDKAEGLALYGYPQCPYCARVLGAIDSLELEIPLRNTMQNADHQKEIVEAMGRGTVPVLRIDGRGGEVEWLPESADIIRYLIARFGD